MTALLEFIESRLKSVNIGHLLLIIFALHLFALSFPNVTSNGGGRVFDEAYYVPASFDLLNHTASNPEHPFFGKVWGALGIAVFGNNFFGWRIFYAIIGVLSVWIMYELASHFLSKEKALLAASMLGFENIFFVHTSLLLLEGPPILFALLGFLAYFKKRYYFSAIAFGLSILSKEWGVFFVGGLVLYHLWANWEKTAYIDWKSLRKVIIFSVMIILVVAIPLWAYDASYHPTSSTTVLVEQVVVIDPRTNVTSITTTTSVSKIYIKDPVQNFEFYFSYQSGFTGCGTINQWNCYPWNWILPFNVSPLPYFLSNVDVASGNGTASHTTTYHPVAWVGMGNLVVWYSIWIIGPVIVWKLATRKLSQIGALSGSLIAATYLPLLYISLVSHRVEYAFYFVNVDPGLALGIPMVVTFITRDNKKDERLLVIIWILAAVVFFLGYFPVNPFGFR